MNTFELFIALTLSLWAAFGLTEGLAVTIDDLLPGDTITASMRNLVPDFDYGDNIFLVDDSTWPKEVEIAYPGLNSRCSELKKLYKPLGFSDYFYKDTYKWAAYFEGANQNLIWIKGNGSNFSDAKKSLEGTFDAKSLKCNYFLPVGFVFDGEFQDRLYCLQDTQLVWTSLGDSKPFTTSSDLRTSDFASLSLIQGIRYIGTGEDWLGYIYLEPKTLDSSKLNNTSVMFLQPTTSAKHPLSEQLMDTSHQLSRLDYFEIQGEIDDGQYLAWLVGVEAGGSNSRQSVFACVFEAGDLSVYGCVEVMKVDGRFVGFGLPVPGNSSAVQIVHEDDGFYKQTEYSIRFKVHKHEVKIEIGSDPILRKLEVLDLLRISDASVSMPTPGSLMIKSENKSENELKIFALKNNKQGAFFLYDTYPDMVYQSVTGAFIGMNSFSGCVHSYDQNSLHLKIAFGHSPPKFLKIPYFSTIRKSEESITIHLKFLDYRHKISDKIVKSNTILGLYSPLDFDTSSVTGPLFSYDLRNASHELASQSAVRLKYYVYEGDREEEMDEIDGRNLAGNGELLVDIERGMLYTCRDARHKLESKINNLACIRSRDISKFTKRLEINISHGYTFKQDRLAFLYSRKTSGYIVNTTTDSFCLFMLDLQVDKSSNSCFKTADIPSKLNIDMLQQAEGVYVIIASLDTLNIKWFSWNSDKNRDEIVEFGSKIKSVRMRLARTAIHSQEYSRTLQNEKDIDCHMTILTSESIQFVELKEGKIKTNQTVLTKDNENAILPYPFTTINHACQLNSLIFCATDDAFWLMSDREKMNTSLPFIITTIICIDEFTVLAIGPKGHILVNERDGASKGRITRKAVIETIQPSTFITWLDDHRMFIGAGNKEGPIQIDIWPTNLYIMPLKKAEYSLNFKIVEMANSTYEAYIDLPIAIHSPDMSTYYNTEFKYEREPGTEDFWSITYEPVESDAHFWRFDSPIDTGRESFNITQRFTLIDRDIDNDKLPKLAFYSGEHIDIYANENEIMITYSGEMEPVGRFDYGDEIIEQIVSLKSYNSVQGKFKLLAVTSSQMYLIVAFIVDQKGVIPLPNDYKILGPYDTLKSFPKVQWWDHQPLIAQIDPIRSRKLTIQHPNCPRGLSFGQIQTSSFSLINSQTSGVFLLISLSPGLKVHRVDLENCDVIETNLLSRVDEYYTFVECLAHPKIEREGTCVFVGGPKIGWVDFMWSLPSIGKKDPGNIRVEMPKVRQYFAYKNFEPRQVSIWLDKADKSDDFFLFNGQRLNSKNSKTYKFTTEDTSGILFYKRRYGDGTGYASGGITNRQLLQDGVKNNARLWLHDSQRLIIEGFNGPIFYRIKEPKLKGNQLSTKIIDRGLNLTIYGNEKKVILITKHTSHSGYLWFWILVVAIIICTFLLASILMTLFLKKYNGRDSLQALFTYNHRTKDEAYHSSFKDHYTASRNDFKA